MNAKAQQVGARSTGRRRRRARQARLESVTTRTTWR